jgi:hypothetical protein
MTWSGIDPVTFKFVAQCLNHCATACPKITEVITNSYFVNPLFRMWCCATGWVFPLTLKDHVSLKVKAIWSIETPKYTQPMMQRDIIEDWILSSIAVRTSNPKFSSTAETQRDNKQMQQYSVFCSRVTTYTTHILMTRWPHSLKQWKM